MGIKYTKGCGVKNRKLGPFQVSEIGLGCMNLSHAYGPPISEAQAERVLLTALDAGVTLFDTAALYGFSTNETLVGKILKPHRQKFTLASKCGMSGVDVNGDGKLVRVIDGRPETIRMTCEAALKRLQTDHIDLYQAHRFDYETPLEETLSAFDDLIRQGKVHYIGVSNWKHTEIQDALKIQDDKGYNRIVSNQPSYSAIYRVIEAKLVPLCEREGISQIVYSPLAQGVLTGKYLPGKKVPTDSRGANKNNNGQFMQGMMNDEFLGHVAKLQPIADAHGITMSQLALAWILSNPNVASAIMGATKPKQVTENAKGSGIKLEAAVIKEINAALKPIVKTDPELTSSPKPRA